VDLPQPLGPRMARCSPRAMRREMLEGRRSAAPDADIAHEEESRFWRLAQKEIIAEREVGRLDSADPDS